MPFRVIGFHHYSLLVRDIDRASEFYGSILGLRRKPRPDFGMAGIWYEMPGGQELHIIESPDVAAVHEGHPAFEIDDIRAAVSACALGKGSLQQDTFTRAHDGSLSAFVRDPDGNLIEFTQHGP